MNFSALIGSPVGHSVGQDIYNRIFRKYGIDSQYLAIEVHRNNLPGFFDLAREVMAGFNITAPYKEVSLKFIDHVDDIVSATGSVNLVKNEGGKLYGYNSDYDGFLMLARKNNIDFSGKKVIIMGSGGAARTITYAIIRNYNSDISIVSRKPGKKSIAGINTVGFFDLAREVMAGFNITAPYKEVSLKFIDHVDAKFFQRICYGLQNNRCCFLYFLY